MKITPGSGRPLLGISGHAGAGHVHSHSGFIQDDSAGFAAAATLIGMAYPADTTIQKVVINKDTVEVLTRDGGTGRAVARRGFTPYEAELVQRAVGLDGLFSQSVAFRSMGRIYGQGVLEAPVALQTAVCLAVVDTFSKKHPGAVMVSGEGPDGNVGACMGAILEAEGIRFAAMAVLNATAGGLGPVEDFEGNLNFGSKGRLMEKLGLDGIPTIVLESKAYIPSISKALARDTFWVRFNREADNPEVGHALINAVETLGLPMQYSDTAYPRYSGEMRQTTQALGRRIADIGRQIEKARTAAKKSALIGDLAILVSQDAGGITYMTEPLHEIAAGGGLVPGMSAVLSMAVSRAAVEHSRVPEFTANDSLNYINISIQALKILSGSLADTTAYLERKKKFNKNELEQLIL